MYAMVYSKGSPNDEDLFIKCLGKAIRDCRWALRLPQRQVAQRAEIDRAVLDEIENGFAHECDLETLRRIAQALQVPVAYLLSEAETRMRFQTKR